MYVGGQYKIMYGVELYKIMYGGGLYKIMYVGGLYKIMYVVGLYKIMYGGGLYKRMYGVELYKIMYVGGLYKIMYGVELYKIMFKGRAMLKNVWGDGEGHTKECIKGRAMQKNEFGEREGYTKECMEGDGKARLPGIHGIYSKVLIFIKYEVNSSIKTSLYLFQEIQEFFIFSTSRYSPQQMLKKTFGSRLPIPSPLPHS